MGSTQRGLNIMDMDFSHVRKKVQSRFPLRIQTIDSHTEGEPTRLVMNLSNRLPHGTMKEKRIFFMENMDHVRKLLTREPRGHRGMFVAAVTEPVSKGADFGLIYMDPRRYPFLCGHATIGAVTTLIETGVIAAGQGETSIVVDTPSGPMETIAVVKKGEVVSVAIRMVPSFVHKTEQVLMLPDAGQIIVDLVCVGGFFAMVEAKQMGLMLTPKNSPRIIKLGMAIIEAANQQLSMRHPARPEVTTVDVTEFYAHPATTGDPGVSAVVYGESHMDRSPCGTGTAAKMTLFHHLGKLPLNQTFINAGPLGTTFQGKLVEKKALGDKIAVVPEIRGGARITGVHEFVVDPRDPFPEGYLL
jgi:proline racemase